MNGDRVIRAGLVVSLTVVTAVAIVISYGHLYDLARSNGERGASAATLPITVDGLILACSLVIVNAARNRSRPPILAWAMLLAGIGATLAGNIAHGIAHGSAGAVIAGWPAAVAAGMFHLAIGEMRRGHEMSDREETPADLREFPHVAEVEPWADDTDPWQEFDATSPTVAPGDPIVQWFEGREPQRQAPDAETDPDLGPVVATARDRFADVIASGDLPSIRKIREECRVGYPRAVQVREALANG